MNVYHVSEIRKNLVSASLLCKKDFKIVIESNSIVISKEGLFVGKGYCCDGLFKLSINKINMFLLILLNLIFIMAC